MHVGTLDAITLALITPCELQQSRQLLIAAASTPLRGSLLASKSAGLAAAAAPNPVPAPALAEKPSSSSLVGACEEQPLPDGYEGFDMDYQYVSPWRQVILAHLLLRYNQPDVEVKVELPIVRKSTPSVGSEGHGCLSQFETRSSFNIPWIIQPVRAHSLKAVASG